METLATENHSPTAEVAAPTNGTDRPAQITHLSLRVPPGRLGFSLKFPKEGTSSRRPVITNIESSCPIKSEPQVVNLSLFQEELLMVR